MDFVFLLMDPKAFSRLRAQILTQKRRSEENALGGRRISVITQFSCHPQPLTSDWYVLAVSSDGSFRKASRLSLKQKQVIFLWCPSIATQRLYSEPLTSTVPCLPRKLVLLGRISLLDKYLAFPFTAV